MISSAQIAAILKEKGASVRVNGPHGRRVNRLDVGFYLDNTRYSSVDLCCNETVSITRKVTVSYHVDGRRFLDKDKAIEYALEQVR